MRLSFFLAVLLVSAGPALAQGTYKISYIQGNEPLIPLIRTIYEELGIQPTFEQVPVGRGLSGTNSGTYDADMVRAPGSLAGFPNLVATGEPLLVLDLLVLARKGSTLRISGKGDLKGHRLGYLNNVAMIDSFLDREGLTAERVPSVTSLEKMLDADRFDLALILLPRFLGAQPEFGSVVGPPLWSLSTFHVVNVGHSDLVPGFDRILKAMKADGRFKKFLSGI